MALAAQTVAQLLDTGGPVSKSKANILTAPTLEFLQDGDKPLAFAAYDASGNATKNLIITVRACPSTTVVNSKKMIAVVTYLSNSPNPSVNNVYFSASQLEALAAETGIEDTDTAKYIRSLAMACLTASELLLVFPTGGAGFPASQLSSVASLLPLDWKVATVSPSLVPQVVSRTPVVTPPPAASPPPPTDKKVAGSGLSSGWKLAGKIALGLGVVTLLAYFAMPQWFKKKPARSNSGKGSSFQKS